MTTGLPADLSDSNYEWVLDFSNFRSAWSQTLGAGVTIAHPDSGWTMHPELVAPTYVRTPGLSRNFYEPTVYSRLARMPQGGYPIAYQPIDPSPPLLADMIGKDTFNGLHATAHGTTTAGVIVSPKGHPDGPRLGDDTASSVTEPRAFVSGAAPHSTVIPFRVADNPLLMDTDDAALTKCIYFCIGLRTRLSTDVGVMSISLGGFRTGTEKKIKDALTEARRAGIVVIAAAGQHLLNYSWMGQDQWYPMFPGSSPDTICAAGCNFRQEPLQAAFYGEEVDITAPAVKVWVPRSSRDGQVEQHRIEQSDGTSYATALTAAACALWQSHHGRDTLITHFGRHRMLTLFRYCLQKSADRPAGWDDVLRGKRGAGILDVAKLLTVPLPPLQIVETLDLLSPWWARPGEWRN